ncbi:hypothetical protein ZIOFF_047627 [Zingiber officinale]|uniref:Uncharacterized protein n=1 Tax=Zingiber officinale TaxID=94328 RepID=A0A8J5KQT1_ZINOF|nr:hypothetical protein ZIOFF_047627 [Zingiber officinale]
MQRVSTVEARRGDHPSPGNERPPLGRSARKMLQARHSVASEDAASADRRGKEGRPLLAKQRATTSRSIVLQATTNEATRKGSRSKISLRQGKKGICLKVSLGRSEFVPIAIKDILVIHNVQLHLVCMSIGLISLSVIEHEEVVWIRDDVTGVEIDTDL